ncbi:putative glycolipid-binding domain-containing protein [Streptomyces sp. NPDC020141]|uniref:putative glycolipid-binding domain-containing protein n=1 Tax=Streptomyces sp. NPDC020141 TaxID=3365065 RepID=UPI00379611CD
MIESSTLTWEVTGSRGYETAWVDLDPGRSLLRARGRAVGTDPEPYWISYALETGEAYVTRELRVRAESAAGARELVLRRDGDGRWSADGAPLPELTGALDCDLGLCPLTNTMPVLRHGLHRRAGEHRFLMAWVRVAELTVHASPQTYTGRGPDGDGGAVIRYASGDFRSDVRFDADGFVVDYPELARRVAAVRGLPDGQDRPDR